MFSERQTNQNLADNIILAASSSGLKTEQELRDYAMSVAEFQGVSRDKVTFSKEGEAIDIKIIDNYRPLFGKLINRENIQFTVYSKSLVAGSGKFNITFVLDTTESMLGEKMTVLQDSMTEFLDEINPFLAANEAQVGIVPFAEYVRIPLSYGSASWINVQPPETRTQSTLDQGNSTNCRTAGTGEGQHLVCDEYVYVDRDIDYEWKGCMGSRKDDYHKTPNHNGRALQGFNGAVGGAGCYDIYNFIEPLTNSYTDLKSKTDELQTGGQTYLPAGLIWGWRTLNSEQPFIEARNLGESEVKSVLVLMTDGSNTTHLRGEDDDMLYHQGTSVADPDYAAKSAAIADILTLEICDNIKAANIKIATIAFDIDDEDATDVLRDCASSTSDYYTADSTTELTQAFKDIGKSV